MGDNQSKCLGPLDFQRGCEARGVHVVTLDRGSVLDT